MYLTKRQREVFDYVSGYIRRHGYSPTFQEIADEVGTGMTTVHGHLANLFAKGVLRWEHNRARSIEEELSSGLIAYSSAENGWEIEEGAKLVPVAALEGLFRAWRSRREPPALS